MSVWPTDEWQWDINANLRLIGGRILQAITKTWRSIVKSDLNVTAFSWKDVAGAVMLAYAQCIMDVGEDNLWPIFTCLSRTLLIMESFCVTHQIVFISGHCRGQWMMETMYFVWKSSMPLQMFHCRLFIPSSGWFTITPDVCWTLMTNSFHSGQEFLLSRICRHLCFV